MEDSKYLKINSANPMYLIINKLNGCLEEIDKNKHLTLVPTNESKEIIIFFEELGNKIRDLIGSITKKSADYDEKYI